MMVSRTGSPSPAHHQILLPSYAYHLVMIEALESERLLMIRALGSGRLLMIKAYLAGAGGERAESEGDGLEDWLPLPRPALLGLEVRGLVTQLIDPLHHLSNDRQPPSVTTCASVTRGRTSPQRYPDVAYTRQKKAVRHTTTVLPMTQDLYHTPCGTQESPLPAPR
jgi:hypothetical protein